MVRFSREWLGQTERIEGWLSRYCREHVSATAPLIAALWGWEHRGSWVSPKYFPPHPSEEGFAEALRLIRQAGGHPFPWPSGYYWNVEYDKSDDGTFRWTDWDDFNRIGRPHVLVRRDGTPFIVDELEESILAEDVIALAPLALGGGHHAFAGSVEIADAHTEGLLDTAALALVEGLRLREDGLHGQALAGLQHQSGK